MLTVHLGGAPVQGATSIRFTTTQRGSGTASWRIDPTRAPAYAWALDSRCEVRSSGALLWAGHLAEPGTDGDFHALGIPALADSTPAINASGEPITGDANAINAAIDRGALDGWQRDHDPMSGGLGGDPQPGLTIAGLLDAMAENRGLRWAVTPHGVPHSYPVDPGEPVWHVTIPGYQYGYDTTDLVTHIYGRYMAGVGSFAYTNITADIPEAVRREEWVNLESAGIISEAEAKTMLLDVARAQGKATPAPTTPITLGRGELRTPGGTVAPGWLVKGGDTIRVWGATDGRSGSRYRDFRVAETDYSDDDQAVSITLAGSKPRGFAAAIEPYTQSR